MELTADLKNMGFSLIDAVEADIDDFMCVERAVHKKYIDEHSDFFGGWNEEILSDAFYSKMKLTFFKKIVLNNETVGFLNYDRKKDKINEVSLRIINKAQNNGIGTLFLTNLIEQSKEFYIPIFIEVIKTNPAQNLYKRMGFELFEEKDVFYFFKYHHIC